MLSFFKKLSTAVVAITVLTGAVEAQAWDRNFSVNNYSSRVVEYLYVSPSWSPYWGADRLGSTVLDTGYSLDVYNNGESSGTCYFDVKIIDDRGREYVYRNVDACSTWSFNHY